MMSSDKINPLLLPALRLGRQAVFRTVTQEAARIDIPNQKVETAITQQLYGKSTRLSNHVTCPCIQVAQGQSGVFLYRIQYRINGSRGNANGERVTGQVHQELKQISSGIGGIRTWKYMLLIMFCAWQTNSEGHEGRQMELEPE